MPYLNTTNSAVEKELMLTKKRLESIFEGNAAGIFVVDANRDIIMVNQRFCDIVGFTKKELVGQNACFAHISQETCLAFREYFLKAKNEGHSRVEYFVRKKGCEGVWVEMMGSPIQLDENQQGVIWSILDISERKVSEETIKKLAFYDPLTGLANRRFLENTFEVMMHDKRRDKMHGALLFLDLDNFKALNDTHGHQAGDIFLKQVASRLLPCIRATDTVARFGGDEFVVILDGLHVTKKKAKEEACNIADTILEALRKPYDVEVADKHITHYSTVSIGLTLFKQEEMTCDAIIRRADKAMYQAKKLGKDRIKFLER